MNFVVCLILSIFNLSKSHPLFSRKSSIHSFFNKNLIDVEFFIEEICFIDKMLILNRPFNPKKKENVNMIGKNNGQFIILLFKGKSVKLFC